MVEGAAPAAGFQLPYHLRRCAMRFPTTVGLQCGYLGLLCIELRLHSRPLPIKRKHVAHISTALARLTLACQTAALK
jgi:hypothetical protein